MADKESGFKLVALAVVLKDKDRKSRVIEVSPTEHFNMDSGAISGDSKKFNVKLPNQHGVATGTNLTGGSVISAKWIPDGDNNRETAPDVCAGETVKLYTFGDTNEYYWATIFSEPSLRRLECVRYVFGNLPAKGAAYTEDTSYWLEYNTFDKRVKLHTSDNDGEACTYDLEFDTKAGVFSLRDNLGNSIELDSSAGKLTSTTTNETTVNTKVANVNAEEFHVNAGKSTFSGPVVFAQGFSSGGPVTGPLHIEGDVTSGGRIIDSGGNTPNHIH